MSPQFLNVFYATLCDGVAKGGSIVAHPRITSHDRHELWRFTQEFGGCEMNRVERADGLDREGAARPRQDDFRHRNDRASPLERPERADGGAFVVDAEASGHSRSHNLA